MSINDLASLKAIIYDLRAFQTQASSSAATLLSFGPWSVSAVDICPELTGSLILIYAS